MHHADKNQPDDRENECHNHFYAINVERKEKSE